MSWADALEAVNSACEFFADTPAVWMHGSTPINLMLINDVSLTEEEKNYFKVTSYDQEIIWCRPELVAGMKAQDLIVMKGKNYKVKEPPNDINGYASIVIERSR